MDNLASYLLVHDYHEAVCWRYTIDSKPPHIYLHDNQELHKQDYYGEYAVFPAHKSEEFTPGTIDKYLLNILTTILNDKPESKYDSVENVEKYFQSQDASLMNVVTGDPNYFNEKYQVFYSSSLPDDILICLPSPRKLGVFSESDNSYGLSVARPDLVCSVSIPLDFVPVNPSDNRTKTYTRFRIVTNEEYNTYFFEEY